MWEQAVDKATYYSDKKNPTYRNPFYVRDIYKRFIKRDFQEALYQLGERVVKVKWLSHVIESAQ